MNYLWDVVTTDPTVAAFHQRFRHHKNGITVDRRKLYNALSNASTHDFNKIMHQCMQHRNMEKASSAVPGSAAAPAARALDLLQFAESKGGLKELWAITYAEVPGYF